MRKIILFIPILASTFFISTIGVNALGGYLTGDYGQVAAEQVKEY